MKDQKELREKLWRSLDMVYIRRNLVMMALLFGGLSLWFAIVASGSGDWTPFGAMLVVMALTMGPFAGYDLWHAWRIFRDVEEYTFTRCVLSNPSGGTLRHSIKFTVVLQDRWGSKFAANTHSIFQTHGIGGLLLEEYVNKTVTIAYNNETEEVVVLG